jgi:hypothetical protein
MEVDYTYSVSTKHAEQIRSAIMSETTSLMEFNALVMMPGADYQRLAEMRERQRRERKEELYSYHTKKYKDCK